MSVVTNMIGCLEIINGFSEIRFLIQAGIRYAIVNGKERELDCIRFIEREKQEDEIWVCLRSGQSEERSCSSRASPS